jgi:molybdate transport system substrate-binding protein
MATTEPTTLETITTTTVRKKTPTTSSSIQRCKDPDGRGSVVVMAASSMVNSLTDVQAHLLDQNPCISNVAYSYGSSATLATQIINGSPADVFISASSATMNTVKNAGIAINTSLFAKNVGEIMVSPKSKFIGSVTGISSLSDSSNPGIKVGVCVASAPCGALTNAILKNVGITRADMADTESPSVEDLVTKIEIGELDAGIVYHSDCQYAEPRGLAKCIDVPATVNSITEYYVVALTSRSAVRSYFDFISGSDFKATLQVKFGFLAP